MGIHVEPSRTMDVTEQERKRDLATTEAGEPKQPGMTPEEATGTRRTPDGGERDPQDA